MLPKDHHEFEFLLFEGFSNMALSCAMEPLRDAKIRAGRKRANWVTTTLQGNNISSSSGLQVTPDRAFQADAPSKRLILVAGYGVREISNPHLHAQLRTAARHCETILAIDSASWLLASSGLLDGRDATIHWQEMAEFAEAFPNVSVSTKPFTRSGKFYTCGSASSVLDLMFEILSDLFGPAIAFDASNMFVYSQDVETAPENELPTLSFKGSPVLLEALDLISQTTVGPISTADMASKLGLSGRSLHRLFLRELQITPGKFIVRFRLKQAKYLSRNTDLSLEKIALRCGYASAPSLCRAYKNEYGETLKESR